MLRKDAPLLFRPQSDWQQWRWGLQFLAQCHDAAFARNVQQLVALGGYSHAALKDVVRATGIEYQRLRARHRPLLHRPEGLRRTRPSGAADAVVRRGAPRGRPRRAAGDRAGLPRLRRSHRRRHLHRQRRKRRRARVHPAAGGALRSARRPLPVRPRRRPAGAGRRRDRRRARARPRHRRGPPAAGRRRGGGLRLVHRAAAALGWAWTCRSTPARATAPPSACSSQRGRPPSAASTIGQDAPSAAWATSCAWPAPSSWAATTRGWTRRWRGPAATCWCDASNRCSRACATPAAEAEGGNPRYWAGLRPATPTNIPYIGRTRVGRLWVNAGHGTLGWTHGAGSGKALAELINGERPRMDFGFLGFDAPRAELRPRTA